MTTFADARLGDRIRLCGVVVSLLAHDETWDRPLRLVTEPSACDDPSCRALRCEAVTPDGRRVHLHRLGGREIDVLESVSELAAPRGEVLAEHTDRPSVGRWSRAEEPESFAERGDYDDTPNDEGDNT